MALEIESELTGREGKQGFASMSKSERRALGQKGGSAPHVRRVGFTSGPDGTAVTAGRKGGAAKRRRKRRT